MTQAAEKAPKFQARRVHYMALVLGVLLLLEHHFVVPILMAAFLFYCYKWEQLGMHDHGRSSKYWRFQAQYMYKKMLWARFEIGQWRKKKLEKDKAKRMKIRVELRRKGKRMMGDGERVGGSELVGRNVREVASKERYAFMWHARLEEIQGKLEVVSKELEKCRRKDLEGDEIEKRQRMKEAADEARKINEEEEDVGQCDPLEKCPKEIWMNVLKEVKDPKDAMSCYYTCTLFRNLLETRMRAEALLVLDNYLNKCAENKWSLQNEDILNCRLVSMSWKLSVDHFLQQSPSQLKFMGHCYPTTVIDSNNDIRQLEGLIQRLVRNYHLNSINPFPSRHLQLKIHSDLSEEDRTKVLASVSVLLNYFGKHLWYVTLYMFVGGDAPAPSSYKTVYNFLGQTPNVKMIDLCFHGNSKVKPSRQEIRELGDFVTFNTFPKLNQLVAMKFDGVPDDIINSALRTNKHIETLDVTPKVGSNHEWIRFTGNTQDLPRLQDCSISGIRVSQLVELQNVNWPLTRLTVELGEAPNELMDLEKLLSTFEKFESSLKYLNFGTKGRSMAMSRLVLPQLEELEVHFEEKVLMDFIIPLRSLKKMKVHIYNEQQYVDEHELEIVTFKDVVKLLHKQDETNIWRLFPELVNVTIAMIKEGSEGERKEKSYIYTRHDGDVVKRILKIC